MKFDIKRDNELIAAGTHFWCKSCITAQPLAEKSPDLQYCQACYDIIRAESPAGGKRDGISNAFEDLPDNDNVVLQQVEVLAEGLAEGLDVAKLEKTGQVMSIATKHAGGRPLKPGKVDRTTLWRRREKEKQGALI